MVGAMPTTKSEPSKSRMSIYVSEANRRRLARIPRGKKTLLVNQALAQVLTDLEKQENFDVFLKKINEIKPVAASKSSEEMVRELRETGTIILT